MCLITQELSFLIEDKQRVNNIEIINHNPAIDTCYLIWDKYMEIPRTYTDVLLKVSLLNVEEQGIENTLVHQNPWEHNGSLFQKLKELGFKKAFIVLGGVHWKFTDIITYAQELDLDVTVAGYFYNSGFMRQLTIVNIDKLIETLSIHGNQNRGIYFGDCINNNDYKILDKSLKLFQGYYHPEEDINECEKFLKWINGEGEYEHEDIDYLRKYVGKI